MASNDFFLEPDDAKTLGDINYMRQSKRVRRTFPKTKGNGKSFEVIKEVSATEGGKLSDNFGNNSNNNGFSSNGNGFESNSQPSFDTENSERRNVDTGLDLFRNMARQIRK